MVMAIGMVLLGLNLAVAAVDAPPAEVLQAATEGIPLFLGNSSPEELSRFGFADLAEVKAASIGEAFSVYTITPDNILRRNEIHALAAIAEPTGSWQVLVYSAQSPACLVTVDRVNGRWEAVSIGSSGLARQLHNFIQSWSRADGYGYQLIRIYQARSDFLELHRANAYLGIVPLVSARMAMGLEKARFDTTDFYTPMDVIYSIAPVVSENLKSSQ